jgi:hypothetical protein
MGRLRRFAVLAADYPQAASRFRQKTSAVPVRQMSEQPEFSLIRRCFFCCFYANAITKNVSSGESFAALRDL